MSSLARIQLALKSTLSGSSIATKYCRYVIARKTVCNTMGKASGMSDAVQSMRRHSQCVTRTVHSQSVQSWLESIGTRNRFAENTQLVSGLKNSKLLSQPTIFKPDGGRMRVSRDGYTHFGSRRGSGSGDPMSPLRRYVLIACSGGLVYWVYSSIDYAPFTGRMRIMGGISHEAELALGRQAFEQLLMSYQGRVLPASHPVSQRVRRVVTRLARTAKTLDADLCKHFEWSVAVADADEPNAMCTPGGRILITTGLFQIIHSDDDLAVIMAHEITHALNRHGVETLNLRRIIWPVIFLINQIFDMRLLPSIFASVFLSLPYSRKLEYEADTVGLLLCAEACYDPQVAPSVFRRLDALTQNFGAGGIGRAAALLSTHPHTLDRAKRLEEEVPKQMIRFKEKCGRDHNDFGFFNRRYRQMDRF